MTAVGILAAPVRRMQASPAAWSRPVVQVTLGDHPGAWAGPSAQRICGEHCVRSTALTGTSTRAPPHTLHIVSGKGGTGKTTVAAALACALATAGRRVLLCEVEGRQGISELFDVPAWREPRNAGSAARRPAGRCTACPSTPRTR